MFGKNTILIFLLGVFGFSSGDYGFHGEQEWDFVNVRDESYLFYWLHYTTASVQSYYERPLILWLQGGPGASSAGYGNFEEIGPLYLNLTKREHSLVKDYNVLFIDSPVGTGYSYKKAKGSLSVSDEQIALDLLYCIDSFLKRFPKFSKVPTYIIGQSYGGKAAVNLAYAWFRAAERGWGTTTLRGIALADSWISPIDSVITWAPYLYQNGLIDNNGYKAIMYMANQTKNAVDGKNWKLAFQNEISTMREIKTATFNIDFYNILTEVRSLNNDKFTEVDWKIKNLMERDVRAALKIPRSFNFNIDSQEIKKALLGAHMKPVTDKVEYLLNHSDLKVCVFNGQLDLIVDTPGTVHWIQNLKWKYANNWLAVGRSPLIIEGTLEGYVKAYGNLKLYSVNRAGHMVPTDNPGATKRILADLTTDHQNQNYY